MAPIQRISPRARAGFSRFEASIAPLVAPAPTKVCNSSMNNIIFPSALEISLITAFNLSSNSPLNLVPAISAPRSKAKTFASCKPSGTSFATILFASPSTIAVFPTPGSPISTGLFFVRLSDTCIVLLISSSRPITGSSFPCIASSVTSFVYFFAAFNFSSLFGESALLPCLISAITEFSFCRVTPFSARILPTVSSFCAVRPCSKRSTATNESLFLLAIPIESSKTFAISLES
ncbi:serine-rich protein, putative [Wolbachia endosymbiont of Drosophila simulans]|nr:serine-rich protein, putative [Wolbachia endosymbiont of Drosophila simulans]